MADRGRSWRKFGVTLLESVFFAALLGVVVLSTMTVLGHASH